jgi:hypothetical protein
MSMIGLCKLYHHYLEWNKINQYQTHLNSIWINEMKANEYNPVHVHQGNLFTGLIIRYGFKITN